MELRAQNRDAHFAVPEFNREPPYSFHGCLGALARCDQTALLLPASRPGCSIAILG
jgi:hypothetical protein